MSDAAKNVARNIAARRKARGLTQVELGAALEPYLGVQWSSAVMSAAEKGRRAWTANEIAAFAEILETEIGDLFAPPSACEVCGGAPPAGFVCGACGEGIVRVHVDEERGSQLQEFARSYLAELASQPHRAMQATADAHGISRATAHRWAQQCRLLGYLPRRDG